MKRPSDLIVGSALLAVLFGCGGGGPSMVHVSNVTVPSKPADCQIPVIQKEADVTKPYEKLCVITSEPARTVEASFDGLREAACKCGADAVVVTEVRADGNKAVVTAAAIRYVNVTIPPSEKEKQ
jgi:hypothetical protein